MEEVVGNGKEIKEWKLYMEIAELTRDALWLYHEKKREMRKKRSETTKQKFTEQTKKKEVI